MQEPEDVKIDVPKKVAVGFPAITSVGYRIWKETYVGRGLKALFKLNQEKGYDCPSCAWPDPDVSERSTLAEYCENGAKAIAWEVTDRKIGEEFFKQYSVTSLLTQSNFWLEKQGRITEPLFLSKGSDHYVPISWQKAYEVIADHLNKMASPHRAAFYTSGRASNEAAFCYQLFARQLGTNNLPDCSNMCHEATGVALSETTGIGKASVKLEDIAKTDLLLIFGQNPGTNAPRMLTELQKLKQNGGKIIAVNPMPETGFMGFKHPQKPWEWIGEGTPLQDEHLQVKINGDLALVKAVLLLLYQEEKEHGTIFDKKFIETKTIGYEAFLKELTNENFEELVLQTGVSEEKIRKTASYIKNAKKIIIAWAMGVTQHRNGEDTIREFVNLLLLKGSIAKEGAGTLPVRGHSNVQGDRTMGIWEKPSTTFLEKLEKQYDFKAPKAHGYNAVETVKAMAEGKIDVFLGLGGNFIQAVPDTHFAEEAMQKLKLTTHIATKLNRSHLVHGEEALILPCLGRTEIDCTSLGHQFVTTEDTAGRVRMSKGDLKPISEKLKSEIQIVCGIAATTLQDKTSVNWSKLADDYSLIRNEIAKVIPGFQNFNQKVQKAGGFYLPNCAREGVFIPSLNKAKFSVTKTANRTIAEGRFILQTMRSHDQFNTTIYGFDDRYRGIKGERNVILMNREDMLQKGLFPKDKVLITSYFMGEERYLKGFKIIPYSISKGCVAVYFPEGNVLVAVDNKSNESQCPASKFVEVSIEKM